MQNNISKGLYWTPRILSIVFIGFLALMSLDVFGPGLSFGQIVFTLFIRNLPALALLIFLLTFWNFEIVIGLIFIMVGLDYIMVLITNPSVSEWYLLSWAIQISVVAFLIGVLFLVGWFKKSHK